MNNSEQLAKIIKRLAKSHKVTTREMLADCELSINTLSSMQSGGYYPRLETLVKIADYLECPIDYLLGRSDNPNGFVDSKDLNDKEKRLVTAYRNKPEMQSAIDKLLGLDDKVIQMDQPEKTYKVRSVARGGQMFEFEVSEKDDKGLEEAIKKTDASDL